MMKYEVFYGSKDTMEKIAAKKARALNPKTMRFQVIDKNAQYEVIPDSIGAILTSNMDLHSIAKTKNLII